MNLLKAFKVAGGNRSGWNSKFYTVFHVDY